ncbi:hypothetical protein CTI12_AA471100 [Artemisia annua]|uniref:Uncharacterized protein n=1 Tax=Artemisia annua TaxID=35608 RepID=A0A2U1LM03_ARTAN|nr:hypothetical protein CTI12_AA471100 [Artemisia annua]
MSQTTCVFHASTVCALPALEATSDCTLGWLTERRKQELYIVKKCCQDVLYSQVMSPSDDVFMLIHGAFALQFL